MATDAKAIDEYINGLPPGRKEAISELRALILKNLPKGYEEMFAYGMIGYGVPLERYPETYNGQPLPYIGLASQKNHMSLYLMGVYGDAESDFRERFTATGKKLNMGKSCVRFKKLDDLPLDVIAKEVKRLSVKKLIDQYEDARTSSKRKATSS